MKPGIDPTDLRIWVVKPVLAYLAKWKPELNSDAAVNLLLMTAAHESRMGADLHQRGGGPAIGIYQMERATHEDIWRWIEARPELQDRVQHFQIYADVNNDIDAWEMHGNLYYATAMARLHYWRVPDAMPRADDINGLAVYAKAHWNTYLGKATVANYADAAREWEIA